MRVRRHVFLTALACAWCTASKCPPKLAWSLLQTNSVQQFRGLAAASETTAWLAGTNGTVLLTTDSGTTWINVSPPLAPADATIQFRDVEASSASHATILSIGTGNASRIYTTSDGGRSWRNSFTNADPDAFYDCLAFADRRMQRGLAVSDPVDRKFRLLGTEDAGATWAVRDPEGMPAALVGEAAFAASGTCLAAGAGGRVYLASGGVDPGRVYRSADWGRTWEVADSAVAGGPSAGVYSVAFRDEWHGVAVGGDYTVPNGTAGSAAWSRDGGATWEPARVFPGGYRSGVAWVPGGEIAVAVGPTGSDISRDGGRTWRTFSNGSFDAVQCPSKRVCWASGAQGRAARLGLEDQ